jgi:putative transcriptional regulator
MTSGTNLSNHLLVAMPSLEDPNFSQTVTLICEHSPVKGALGIVLNRPLPMTLSEVLQQMRLETSDVEIGARSVLRGGPVNKDRGFVIHRAGGSWDSTHKISEQIQVTTSRDVLAAMAKGEGPGDAFIALGYAGWEAGQLERELLDNAWLALPVDEHIVFGTPFDERWSTVWRRLGINTHNISRVAGHA